MKCYTILNDSIISILLVSLGVLPNANLGDNANMYSFLGC